LNPKKKKIRFTLLPFAFLFFFAPSQQAKGFVLPFFPLVFTPVPRGARALRDLSHKFLKSAGTFPPWPGGEQKGARGARGAFYNTGLPRFIFFPG